MRGDDVEREEESARPKTEPSGVKNPARRRLARAGMATPVVLGALASKPVLGTTTNYWCTISGKLSGNLSNHSKELECKSLGKGPDFWKAQTGWPAGFTKGTLPNNSCNFGGGLAGTAFNSYAFNGKTLGSAFKMKSVAGVGCVVVDALESGFGTLTLNATMLQLLNTGGATDTVLKSLGRATVASLLNAKAYSGTLYPLTQEKIIEMFNAVYLGGSYVVSPTVSWKAVEVRDYFASLYT